MKFDLITATLFLLKFSFSPGVHAVHRSQFQATSALWSKASNLHYSLVRLPPLPPPPAKHTQLSYVGLRHSRGGCLAGPGRPSVTDPARHPPRRARWVGIRESGSAGSGPVGLLWRTRAPSQTRHDQWLACVSPPPRTACRFCHRKCRGRFCHRMFLQ